MKLYQIVDSNVQFMPVERMKKLGLYQEVKIRCCYCDIKDICPRRPHKEAYEARGIMTRCPFTPNRPKKKKK